MARLVHLNGPPAVGKSTVARRLAADRPGLLVFDLDVRRITRGEGLVEIGVHLAAGRDVVVPQLVAEVEALDDFARVAREAGAEATWVMLTTDDADLVTRWRARSLDTDAWAVTAAELIAREGGDEVVLSYQRRLTELSGARAEVIVVQASGGEHDATYAAVCDAIDRAPAQSVDSG